MRDEYNCHNVIQASLSSIVKCSDADRPSKQDGEVKSEPKSVVDDAAKHHQPDTSVLQKGAGIRQLSRLSAVGFSIIRRLKKRIKFPVPLIHDSYMDSFNGSIRNIRADYFR